jgi:serine phosphatase RsbU (regulator of sigma subunit)
MTSLSATLPPMPHVAAVPWWRFWQRSIQRQLVIGIALVHALLMTIFVFDLTHREYNFLYQQSLQQAGGLAQTLAANSSPWMLTNDVVGLTEIIHSQAHYPDLSYAMVTTLEGKVLTHSDKNYIGQFLSDAPSLTLLQQQDLSARNYVVWQSPALLDMAAPVFAGEQIIGWARVGISQQNITQNLHVVTRNGLFYTAFAIALGIVFAVLMARGLTHGLHNLTQVAEKVRKGEREVRADVSRVDELSTLAHGFNAMLDAIHDSETALQSAYRNEQNSRNAAEQARAALHHLNEELEQRVNERTADLAKANHEILQLNERLQEENLRMGTELDVTRRLQQMILPRTEELDEIKDLDIAGFMEPANEVGGDYYDILPHQGGIKIGIGDVTGHGLESGVLMLMVQTAVRTLLEHGVADPSVFMSVLNRTIYQNLKRIQSDKNLTLSLIDYKEGNLCLSGQHEEVLLVRVGGQIERIDTIDLGFMVGLQHDISSYLDHSEMYLHPGDTLVLYTDGIPEAHNAAREQYGVDRLCQVLSANWEKSAIEIQRAVVADVYRHIGATTLHDDITLVVIKRKIIAH